MLTRIKQFFHTYKTPISIFVLGNIIIAVIMFLGTDLALYILPHPLPNYITALFKWDTGWYQSIVQHGYNDYHNSTIQSSIVFFPLFPMLIKAVTVVIHSFTISAMIVNEIFLFLSFILFYRLEKKLQIDDTVIEMSLYFYAFFPFSFFLFLPYTESLFMFFIFLVFVLLEDRKYLLAAIAIGIATAIRTPALVLIVVYIAFLVDENWEGVKKLLLKKEWLYLPLTITGIVCYVLFLKIHFNDPLSFLSDEAAWSHTAVSVQNAISPIRFLITGWHHVRYRSNMNAASIFALYYDTIHYVNVIFLFLPVLGFWWIYKNMKKPYIIFCLLYLIGIMLSSDAYSHSVGRYAIALFPFYIALGYFAKEKNLFTYLLMIAFTGFMIFAVIYINFSGWIA